MKKTLNNNELGSVSVVIPTLGGESLKSTIDHLNAGFVVPKEILICIPAEESHKVSTYAYPNVKVLVTDCRGQVAQRAVGFRKASHDLVMQLDDDILVEKHCIEFLVMALNSNGQRCAVAPALRWLNNSESVYKNRLHPVFSTIFYWLLNGRAGYRAGIVTKAGTEIGINPATTHSEPVNAEWLPGGCILHRKSNLILDNYFPFKGKAFCEDIIHSFLLTERSIRLFVNNKAICFVNEPQAAHIPIRLFLETLCSDHRARRYYVGLSSRSKPRMYCYYLAKIARHLTKYKIFG